MSGGPFVNTSNTWHVALFPNTFFPEYFYNDHFQLIKS